MASAVLHNNVSVFQSQLNEALECQQKNKQSLQELELKIKIFSNDPSFDFLMESIKSKVCEEKMNEELQHHLENEQQKGKNYLHDKNYGKMLRHLHQFFPLT